MMNSYNAAIYLRLSKEDRENNNSIDMQRQITTKYAKSHNYSIIDEYIDNGYSGILASRPELNRLMVDIVRNKINMVIVKDMSRLTRDKNMTSYYTDIFFPDNDVRLISVTEYIDTGERYEIDDVVALRGIVNQSYLEDISKKIKAVKRNYKEQGKFIESSVAYGYKKSNIDKQKLVIDENVEYFIKYIYKAYLEGKKPLQIANDLNIKRIPTASQYFRLKRTSKYWTKSMVNRILNNPIYAGDMVLNKYENNITLKKKITTPKQQYNILENTHPAIITREDYNKVQEMKGHRTKKENQTYIYLLKGLTFCKNCGRKMTYKNSKPIRIDNNGVITGTKNNLGYFICEEHYRHKEICDVSNKIMESHLNQIVLNKISDRLKQMQIIKFEKDIKKVRDGSDFDDCSRIKRELSKQEKNFKSIYLQKIEGKISQDKFLIEYNEYKNRINELKLKLESLAISNNTKTDKNDINKIIMNFEECKNFDNNIIKKLIEKIEIDKNKNVGIFFKI